MKKKLIRMNLIRMIIVLSIILLLLIGTVLTLTIRNNQPLSQDHIESIVKKAQARYDLPAVSIQVFDTNKVTYKTVAGVRGYNTSNEATEEDYFHIGSCSKSLLALIAAKEVEKGHIQWHTPFFAIFEDLKPEANPAYIGITLEDLLNCNAGIKPYTLGTEAYPNLSASADPTLDFATYLLQLEPSSNITPIGNFEFLYSNASYTLAAMMLEKVSNKSYADLLSEISNELEIETFIGWPYEIGKDQPYGHFVKDHESLVVANAEVDYHLNDFIIPAGDISMKPNDFTKFVMLHLKGHKGESDFLSKAQFEKINLGAINNKTTDGERYSMGAYSSHLLGLSYIAFDGTAGTFYARGVVLPEDDFGFTILYNSGSIEAVEYITMKIVKAKYNWWWLFWI